jgi:hypothetical protein
MHHFQKAWPRYVRVTLLLCFCLFTFTVCLYAQDKGEVGIGKATELVKKYFEKATLLLYGLGGVIGLYGAVKVYSKWSAGDQETQKAAAAWFGGCIFLVLVVTILRAFLGL